MRKILLAVLASASVMFAESNYVNNAAEVVITVPDRVGKVGWGPGGGQGAQQEIHASDTKPGSNKNGN
jgi:hypothetical protein